MARLRPILIALVTLGVVWGGVAFVTKALRDKPLDGGVDPADHKGVCIAALTALAQSDLDGARPYMTERGFAQFEREMRLFRDDLADPVKGVVHRERAKDKIGAGWEQAVDDATSGDERAVWRFLGKLYPMDDPPRLAGIHYDPARPKTVTYFYWGPTGVRRGVALVEERGAWRINLISLL